MHSLISCTYCNQALHHKDVWEGGDMVATHSQLQHYMVSFRPWLFYPKGKNPGTHWTEGWVGPRADLNAVTKIKIPVRFQAFRVVTIFCNVKQCGLVNIHQRFVRMNCIHLQSKRVS